MAKSSIHIQRAVDGSVGHNSREHFSYSVVFTDEENECTHTVDEAYSIYREELKERTQAYTERTGQKLQKSAVTQLSAIINLEQHHTLKDLESIKKHLEETFGTRVYQMAIHRDEGKLVSKIDGTELYSGKDFFLNPEDKKFYSDKQFIEEIDMQNYEVVKNYHGHFEMMGLDTDGNAIRQKMNRTVLKQMQTFVAKELNMERGKENTSYSKDEMKQILAVTGKKSDYKSPTLFSKKFNEVAKELGIYKEKTKRRDTHQFKDLGAIREEAKREAFKEVADVKEEVQTLKFDKKELEKQLKELNGKFRTELQQNGALRADYAQLEALNKELKEAIKSKDLTEKELHSKFDNLEKSLLKKENEIKELSSSNKQLEKQNISLKSENQELIKSKDDVLNQNKTLEAQKEVLEDKVITLEEKVATNQNMSDYKAIKEEIIENKENIEVFEDEYKLPKTGNLNKLLLWVIDKFNEFKEIIKAKDYEIAVLTDEILDLKKERSSFLDREKEKGSHLNQIVDKYSKARTGTDKSEALNLQKKEVKKVDLSRFINLQKPTNSFLDKLNAIDEKNNAEIDTKINNKKGRDRD